MTSKYQSIQDINKAIRKLKAQVCKLAEGGGTGNGYAYIVEDYDDLIATATSPQANEFAYLKNSQGTAWLPWDMGGTYYPSGTWFYTGTEWINDKSQIALELYNNDLDISQLQSDLTDHVTDLANPHQTAGGGDTITDVVTDDTVDTYYRGYNRNGAWTVEKFLEIDINIMTEANIGNNPIYLNLTTAWTNRATLTYA